MSTATETVIDVSPAQLREWLDKGEAVVVDVREPVERASEHIAGSHAQPIGELNTEELCKQLGDKRIVFHCRGGGRSRKAATKMCGATNAPAYHLAGGIEAWKAAGFDVKRAKGAPKIDVMRQVQMVAGSLVLIGVILGVAVSEYFLILSGFVGGGLVFAGASGFCGMAKLLALMPWNKCAA